MGNLVDRRPRTAFAAGPAVQGGFDATVGTFHRDSFDAHDRATRTRLLWAVVDADHLRWEQALSDDHGEGWMANRVITFERIAG